MRSGHYIKKAVITIFCLCAVFGLILSSVKGELDLRDAVSAGSYPRYPEGAPDAVAFPININTATLRELKALDGFGDAKAEAVIRYREEHGSFASVDELINVSGIGKATLNRIRELVTI